MLGIDQDDRTDPILVSLGERLERLKEFRARLLSPRTTGFILVMMAERLPIEETARAIAQLDDAGIRVGALVVNRLLPATGDDPFLAARREQERIYLDEIDRRFAAIDRVRVAQLPADVHGIGSLEQIAALLLR
jgi:arsenite-transporting ATPase